MLFSEKNKQYLSQREDINKEIANLTEKGANIALKPVETQVGYMARVVDPNGINIVLVQHTR